MGRFEHAVIDEIALAQPRLGLGGLARGLKLGLGGEDVVMDAEQFEIGADAVHHRGYDLGPEQRQPLAVGLANEAAAELGGERLAHGDEVIARIEPLRDRADVLAQRLAVAQMRRAGERVDLAAGVVDVVLARHCMAGEFEQPRQRIAHHRAAAMAHVHRPGRVGRDVLDIDPLARTHRRATIGAALRGDGGYLTAPGRVGQLEVDEAGTGNIGRDDIGIVEKMRHHPLGQSARVGAGGLGQHHRGVGREVAVRGIAGRLDGYAGAGRLRRQRALQLERVEHGGDLGGEGCVKGFGLLHGFQTSRTSPRGVMERFQFILI